MKIHYLFSFTRYLNRLFKLNKLGDYHQLRYYHRNKEEILKKRKEIYHKNKHK